MVIYKTFKISILFIIYLFILSFNLDSEESKTWSSSKKAQKFVKDNVIIDFINSPFGIGWNNPEQLNDYFERASKTGITGGSITLATKQNTWEDFLKEYHIWKSAMDKTDDFIYINKVDDIKKAKNTGKYAVIWNSQTSTILHGDLKKIAILKEMGLKSMQLVYNENNKLGGGVLSYYRNNDKGLTIWGKKVIDELVKQGIVIDLSHTGRNTCRDVINYMEIKHKNTPVIYSNSLPNGLYKNRTNATIKGCYRNISDQQAIAAAKIDGVVCPTFTEWMMDGIWQEDINPKQCAEMIDYYVKLIGIDHVGIATDDRFIDEIIMSYVEDNPDVYHDDGYKIEAFKQGAVGAAELAKILPAITDELWQMGYTNQDIKKVYGENMIRVYKKTW